MGIFSSIGRRIQYEHICNRFPIVASMVHNRGLVNQMHASVFVILESC